MQTEYSAPKLTTPFALGPQCGLDLTSLAPTFQKYFQDGLVPFTKRAYNSVINNFYLFCTKYIYDPFPITENVVCCFSVYMTESGLSVQTVKTYMAAIRNAYISLGLPDLREQSSFPVLKRVQAGIS